MNKTLRIRQLLEFLRFTPFDTSTDVGRSHERYRLIALSSFSSLLSKFIISLIGLVSVPFTINYLGKEQFGLWMVVSSLVVWAQLADFGISNGLLNALAEAHGREDRKASISYISTAILFLTIIAFIFLIPMVFLSHWIPWGFLLNIQKPSLIPLSASCFLAAGVIFIVCIPLSVINRIYNAYQLGYISNTTQIISSIFSFAGLLVAIFINLSLPWLVVLVSSGPLIGNLFAWLILPRFLPWCRIDFKSINIVALKRISHSSTPLFIFQIGALLINEMINVVIARVSSLSMVADYNILLRIYLFVFALGISFSSSFYPAIREAYERKERTWVVRAISRVTVVRFIVLLAPVLVLIFFGDRIIYFWIKQPLDSEFGFFGWTMFSMCLLLSTLSSTLGEILISLDDIWSQIKIVFLSAAVVLTGIYYLIPLFRLSGIYISIIISTIYPIFWSLNRIRFTVLRDLA
jgi:O-antigen/teichoic acid export membrane protein